jgi:glucuronate isomerase
MVTDSRSFLSYSRHDYFRRIVCTLLGDDVEAGLVPDDRTLLDGLVRAVCFTNARDWLELQMGKAGR